MLPPHIRAFSDLLTSREATSKGFFEQAQRKGAYAPRYTAQARQLLHSLGPMRDSEQLVANAQLQPMLAAAVGLSEKAISNLIPQHRREILGRLLSDIVAEAGDSWREELVYRFLLTRGDSLGGTSRNIIGAMAKAQFTAAIIDALGSAGRTAQVQRSTGRTQPVQSISWDNRLIVFDSRSPLIDKKNIDVIVLDTTSGSETAVLLRTSHAYVVCGELKGGIDPAGADEHWKTANTALDRVRTNFGLHPPATFFASAAIEEAMAREIMSQLRTNRLTYAANLTRPEQVLDLAYWLIGV